MKKIALVGMIVTLAGLASCKEKKSKLSGEMYKEYGRFDLNRDSILDDLEIKKYSEYMADSIIKVATVNLDKQNDQPLFKDSIQIIKKYTSDPNSAGGVDLSIIWKNKSKRTIKYATFEVSAINAVNDEVYSEIRSYEGAKYVKVTGPIKPNQTEGYGTYWECLWYNSTIHKCKIRSVELEYMDGPVAKFSFD